MSKIALLTAFAFYALSSVRAALSACTPPPRPNIACTSTDQSLAVTPTLDCEEDYDCCLCSELICTECEFFMAEGERAAFGVKNIAISGIGAGAEIFCVGEHSCRETIIRGSNIESVKCGVGVNVGEPGIKDSCVKSKMILDCVDTGCDVYCDGDSSCKLSDLWISNPSSIHCFGDRSCVNADILLLNPQQDFTFRCSDYRACRAAQVYVFMFPEAGESLEYEGITCSYQQSCAYAEFLFGNWGESPVTIREINCVGEDACEGATFKTEGNVVVKKCNYKCDESVCDDSHILNMLNGICEEVVITTTDPPAIANDKGSLSNNGLMALRKDGNPTAAIFVACVCVLVIGLSLCIGLKVIKSKKEEIVQDEEADVDVMYSKKDEGIALTTTTA